MTAPTELDGAKVLFYTDKSTYDFGYVYYQEDGETVVITALVIAKYEGSES